MAPEIARRTGHTYSADIWSVGCTIIEMLTGIAPWANISKSVKEVLVLIANSTEPPQLPNEISDECRDFLKLCLQIDPKMRRSPEELLTHPFLTTLTVSPKMTVRPNKHAEVLPINTEFKQHHVIGRSDGGDESLLYN